ncbi:hypothetical protein SLA2020_421100 [Shorea laevis]
MALVMKAKYYPTTNFLEARLGGRPSYAWRSILSSRELLQEGLIWQVGNGENIQIWHDKWVSHPTSYKIQSPPQKIPVDSRVRSLIDPSTRWWNFSLIQDIFWPDEAKRICSMALSPSGQPDRLVWKGTSSGVFTVRSAYHIEVERSRCLLDESSIAPTMKLVWQKI